MRNLRTVTVMKNHLAETESPFLNSRVLAVRERSCGET